jgi:hypothetical protein
MGLVSDQLNFGRNANISNKSIEHSVQTQEVVAAGQLESYQ